MQNKQIVYDSERVQANTEEREKKNVCCSHWRLLTWKFELILMNERNVELFKVKLLIKLYQCSNYNRKFDDLKTNASTRI